MTFNTRRELRTIHIFTEKFTEGEWHWFKVMRELSIPGDEIFYLLESASGNRLLLPTLYYQDYGIRTGNRIYCRIDKINCSGKIFLEPEHPVYKPGMTYTFRVTDKYCETDRKGRKQEYMKLTGPGNDRCTAIINDDIPPDAPAIITANLERIRKGVLIINNLQVLNSCS